MRGAVAIRGGRIAANNGETAGAMDAPVHRSGEVQT